MDLFLHSHFDQGFFYALRVNLVLHFGVSRRKGFIADSIEDPRDAVSMVSDQGHGLRGENLRGVASGPPQAVLDVIPGFLHGKGLQAGPDRYTWTKGDGKKKGEKGSVREFRNSIKSSKSQLIGQRLPSTGRCKPNRFKLHRVSVCFTTFIRCLPYSLIFHLPLYQSIVFFKPSRKPVVALKANSCWA